MAQPPPAMDWITELDDIDPTYTVTTFQHTMLGQLPTEVLEIVTTFLGRCELVSIARVNSKLRALAERQLYHTITLPNVREPTSDSDSDRYDDDNLCSTHLLYCTLLERPDLAEQVKDVRLTLSCHKVSIRVQGATVLPGGSPFAPQMKIEVREAHIASALLEQLQNVEALYTSVPHNQTEKLCPWLKTNHAPSAAMKGLQKLESLSWTGSDFHWLIAKRLPSLRSLRFITPYEIMRDDLPEDTSDSLENLSLSTGSGIFNPSLWNHEALEPFLAHFPSLQSFNLEIDDQHSSYDSLRPHWEGSSAFVLAKLRPIATSLRHLSIVSVDSYYPREKWVQHIHSSTFKDFESLESLDVPFTCLFDINEALQLNNLPSLNGLLPSTLKTLHIYAPKVIFLEVLSRFARERDVLPALETIELECSNDGGDGYNVFVFENHLHPAPDTLRSLNIDYIIYCREGHWHPEWDDYDIEALEIAAWQPTLGPPFTGISIVPTNDSANDEEGDDCLEDLVQMYLARQPKKSGKSRNTSRSNASQSKMKWAKSSWTTRLRKGMAKNDATLQAASNMEFEEIDKGIGWAQWEANGREWKLAKLSVRWPIVMTQRNRAALRRNNLPIPEGQ